MSSTNPYAAPKSPIEAPASRGAAYSGYAGFWVRFVAYLIDNVVLTLLSLGLGLAVGIIGAVVAKDSPALIGIIAQLLAIVLFVAYYAGMESSEKQATFGKQIMGLKVTDLRGRRISFGKATGRFFCKILSGIILAIGFIMAAFTEKKQALHDMLAGTLVMKVR